MNTIKVKNDEVTLVKSDNLIEVTLSDKLEIFDVQKIDIKVVGSTDLEIIYEGIDEKLDIEYLIMDDVNFSVTEINKQNQIKVQYKYFVGQNTKLDVTKFYNCNIVKELDIIYFNGEKGKVDYNFKTIAKGEQQYNMFIYHSSKNTSSNIINNGVNIDNGKIKFNVTGIVYKGITGCEVNQSNRIITYNDNKCEIRPNLLIDENDVIANHSGLIGKFEDDELFYLMSRGISEEDSIHLLTRGFLKSGIKENKIIDEIIDTYWR